MPEDRDWFRVELQRGTEYRFDVYGMLVPNRGLSIRHAIMYGIYDSRGRLVQETSTATRSGARRVYFTPGSSPREPRATGVGTYYVSVGGPYPLMQHMIGDYLLLVNRVRDDYSTNTSTVGVVAVGGTTRGDIELPYDHDWIRVELTQGLRYKISRVRDPQPSQDNIGPALIELHDPEGLAIESTQTPSYRHNSPIVYTAQVSGAHYIEIAGDESLGSYTVSVEEVTP